MLEIYKTALGQNGAKQVFENLMLGAYTTRLGPSGVLKGPTTKRFRKAFGPIGLVNFGIKPC